jgi:hydroxypyruvate isomerase
MKRKEALKILSVGTMGLAIPFQGFSNTEKGLQLKGNINHSASRWCYGTLNLEDLCKVAKRIGLVGIDLLKPSEIDRVQQFGLKATMVNPEEFSLSEGFNDANLHADLQATYSDLIDIAAAKGVRNIICFSGNRNGKSDEEGLNNCVKGLTPLVKKAQSKGVVMHMELLNSKVDHQDYQCDHSEWGVELCKRLGSDHFKLLYDIYHMQIMEGDLIATIRKHKDYFGHYHTGGVPGRNEIDDSQEIYYPAVMKAIVETGFKGVVAQEFIPTATDPVESLEASIQICDV